MRIRRNLGHVVLITWALTCLGACDDPGSDDGPSGPALTIIEPGEGEASDGPIWPLVDGTRFDDTLIERPGDIAYYSSVVPGPNGKKGIRMRATPTGGLDVVGLPGIGTFPRADAVLLDEMRDGLQWRSDPFGGIAERRVELGDNPEGVTSWHLARTATATLETRHRSPLGYRRTWSITHDDTHHYTFQRRPLYESDDGLWRVVEGIGPEHHEEFVVPKQPVPRGEAPRAELRSLGTVLGGDVEALRGARVMRHSDGSTAVLLHVVGLVQEVVVVEDQGGTSFYTTQTSRVCLELRDGQLDVTDECVDPLFFAFSPTGEVVELPYTARTEHREANPQAGISAATTELRDYKGVPYISDGELRVLGRDASWRWDGATWQRESPIERDDVGLFGYGECAISISPGDGFNRCKAPVLLARESGDGSVSVFGVPGNTVRIDGMDVAGESVSPARRLGMAQRLSVAVSASGRTLYDVTPDGRVYELRPSRDGMLAAPLAALDVPRGHTVQSAVAVGDGELLVVTQRHGVGVATGAYNYDSFSDLEPADEVWRYDASIAPDPGEPHFWLADIPASRPEPAPVPATHAVSVRAVGRNLQICLPPDYGSLPTDGWTLAGNPAAVLASDDGCILLVHPPGAMEITNLPGAHWATGVLPGAGEVELAVRPHFALEDLWSCMNGGVSSPNVDPQTIPQPVYHTEVSGGTPRLDPVGRLHFLNRAPWGDPVSNADTVATGVADGCRLGDDRPGASSVFAWSHEAERALPLTDLEESVDIDGTLRPAGVEVGGILYQSAVLRMYDSVAGAYDDDRFIAPPPGDGRHEVLLRDDLLCGTSGSDIYCQGLDSEIRGSTAAPANPSSGQWWPLPRGVDPAGEYCNTRGAACDYGVAWLLGATAEAPSFVLVDPGPAGPEAGGINVETHELSTLLSDFPVEVDMLRVTAAYIAPLVTARREDPTRLFALVGARSNDATRFWLVRFEGTAAAEIGGPWALETAELGRWGQVVQNLDMPRLRLRPKKDVVYDPAREPLAAFQVANDVLGDVTPYMVEASGSP